MKIVAIIPARFDSSRFPGKPLVDILGKSMIQRVYEQVTKLSILHEVIVATDDDRIMDHVRTFGASVYMTSNTHLSGTDRVAEVANKLKGVDIILNIQGDEPFILPQQIKELIDLFKDPNVQIASLVSRINEIEEIDDKNIVKASFDDQMFATHFSRSPFEQDKKQPIIHYKHLGIYGFERKTLLKLSELKPGILEMKENLEQLRWLENGYKIKLGITDLTSFSIDTPEDLEKALKKIPTKEQ